MPIESGISPENLIIERSKNFSEVLLQLDFGRDPLRDGLSLRSRVCKLGRSRMLFSSFPRKKQPRRLRVVKEEDRFIKDLGLIKDIFVLSRRSSLNRVRLFHTGVSIDSQL